MTRYISFFLLLAFIILMGIMFYRVMSSFLLPLFLAVILAVIFRPLYIWVLNKCKQRKFVAGVITTTFVTLVVVVPLAMIATFAVREAVTALSNLPATYGQINTKVDNLRNTFGLNKPFKDEFTAIQLALQTASSFDEASEEHELLQVMDQLEVANQALMSEWMFVNKEVGKAWGQSPRPGRLQRGQS